MHESSSHTAGSYDSIPDFGTLYDAVPAYGARGDVSFYVDEARGAQGRVLELGCGTGRVLIAMARAGAQVTGLDASAAMLARCRARIAAEDPGVQARVEVHQADARTFSLAHRFALVVAPFRIFQHLTRIDDQLACLAAISRQLAPGGRLIFDVFNPSFAHLVKDRTMEVEDTPPQAMPDGRIIRRAYRVPRVRWVDQVSETEIIYYVAPRAGEPEQRHVQAFEMRWYLRAELEHLLARAGFRIDAIRGDFDGAPLTDSSPEMIVSAVRD